ncbi:unnamed protein product, partial [Symbiodinium sp. KB8]
MAIGFVTHACFFSGTFFRFGELDEVWAWKQRPPRPGIELAGPAGPSVPIRSLCWSPDGAQLLIGSD